MSFTYVNAKFVHVTGNERERVSLCQLDRECGCALFALQDQVHLSPHALDCERFLAWLDNYTASHRYRNRPLIVWASTPRC